MKAIQIKDAGILEVVDVEKPEMADDEVLLKINFVGFCGSDLNTFRGLNPMVQLPIIPGHEIGATIAAVGKDVPQTLKPGMVVTVNPYTNCGKCASCRAGQPNACEHNQTLGVQRNGAMKEYISLPWQKIIPAEGITPRDCAMIEPMSVGFHAVNRGQVSEKDTVVVFGCGMIGMGAIVAASLRGATVIAVDIDDEKLGIAKSVGAAYGVNSMNEDLHERLLALTDGFGPSVCIEAVGNPHTYRSAIEEVSFAGRVVYIGYAKADIAFTTKLFVQKELTIRGSRNAMPTDFEAVIERLKGGFDVSPFISEVVEPEDAFRAMTDWNSNPGKVFRILVKL
ncbi:MAG: zinc-binding alcohol dehydrogenase family protein [Bacteroidaceae bacterium]|nr:zinc-binding alcohol dehydrogenase family protein [Bacteroidaceae bacterium]